GRTGPIDPWIPVMLFTILFSLSMDYELFLMSRVREHWVRHRDSQAAVTDGLAATARVITAAAAIMVCVFASFVLSDVRPLRMFRPRRGSRLAGAPTARPDGSGPQRHAAARPDRMGDAPLARPAPSQAAYR